MNRQPYVSLNQRKAECCGQHANHRECLPIQGNLAAHNVRIRAEARLPCPVADHDGRRRSGLILPGYKRATAFGADLEYFEKVCGNKSADYAIGMLLSGEVY